MVDLRLQGVPCFVPSAMVLSVPRYVTYPMIFPSPSIKTTLLAIAHMSHLFYYTLYPPYPHLVLANFGHFWGKNRCHPLLVFKILTGFELKFVDLPLVF